MSLTNSIHESLPYVDKDPSAAETEAASACIASELAQQQSATHPSLAPPLPTNTSALIESELLRIESKQNLKAVDISRYETVEAPAASIHHDVDSVDYLWHLALQKAYTSHAYLAGRNTNLALLEKYGKNSWLIANSQLEDELRALENELAKKKREIDEVVIERKTKQEAAGGEIKSLEETWKKGVGRVLETELAAEELRRNILRMRRERAR